MSNAQAANLEAAAEPVPLPSPCRVGRQEAVDTADIARRLNSGELGPAAPDSGGSIVPVFRCEDGPKRVS